MIKIEELVEKAKIGNKEACIELIESMRNDLYRIAMSKLSNEEDAKDVVQETITNAYFSIQGKKDLENFKSWITTILINECKAVYKKRKRNSEIGEKLIESDEGVNYLDDNLSFDEMIEDLNSKEQEVFSLYYKYRLTIKLIAKKLGISENTVKTILSRGRVKLKKVHKSTTILMFVLCILVATSVIAVSIIKYIQGLFEVNSIGSDNNGVMLAIENMDWYQEIDMNYIDVGNGYMVKAEYLLMDEMNLYMVFDIKSEKDISKFTDVNFEDLKITNEKSEVIYDKKDIFANYYAKAISTKVIDNNKNSMKVLVYMYTNNFPISNSIDISFSKIMFLSKPFIGNKKYEDIPVEVNLKVELDEKFINRKYKSYDSENDNIEKAIITETGFYAIISQNREDKIKEVKLIDENGKSYKCYFNGLTELDTKVKFKYIIITNFNDMNSKNLTLIINKNEYKLIEKD